MASNTITVSVTVPEEYLKAHQIRLEKVRNHFVLHHERDRHRLAPLELFTQWENGPHQVLEYKVFPDEAAQTHNKDLQDMARDPLRGFQFSRPSSIFDTALAATMNPGSSFQSTFHEDWERKNRAHKETMERLQRERDAQKKQHESEMEKIQQEIRQIEEGMSANRHQ